MNDSIARAHRTRWDHKFRYAGQHRDEDKRPYERHFGSTNPSTQQLLAQTCDDTVPPEPPLLTPNGVYHSWEYHLAA